MIKISGSLIDTKTILDQYASNSIEAGIAKILTSSNEVYIYDSENQLKFELKLRKSIVNAAVDLNRSNLSFRVFRKSRCNPDYWQRTSEGGFLLQKEAKPSEAVKDIYIHSSHYGTECSTAMIIVYYKSIVDIFPEELFNKMFSEIYLMNWMHLDKDLGIVDHIRVTDYLPGDGRYFKNPDVDPLTPEWQGENAFDIGGSEYYGHGIGIANAGIIIHELNNRRISGSKVSAYLLDSAKRPDFNYLAGKYYNFGSQTQAQEMIQ
jgi:protein-glutamine gamma-glutamyltransferase